MWSQSREMEYNFCLSGLKPAASLYLPRSILSEADCRGEVFLLKVRRRPANAGRSSTDWSSFLSCLFLFFPVIKELDTSAYQLHGVGYIGHSLSLPKHRYEVTNSLFAILKKRNSKYSTYKDEVEVKLPQLAFSV